MNADSGWIGRLRKLGELAIAQGIAVSSHDDDSPQRAEQSKQLGSTISEFPITLETAQYADTAGHVCMRGSAERSARRFPRS